PRMRHVPVLAVLLLVWLVLPPAAWSQQAPKPNIRVIMGDDIGGFNPGCYNSGIMGCRTPNIDRIAAQGARFTGFYDEERDWWTPPRKLGVPKVFDLAARSTEPCASGPNPSPSSACPRSSTCARTPASARTSPPTPATTGSYRTQRECSSPRRPS